jgi:hypothetical protein
VTTVQAKLTTLRHSDPYLLRFPAAIDVHPELCPWLETLKNERQVLPFPEDLAFYPADLVSRLQTDVCGRRPRADFTHNDPS